MICFRLPKSSVCAEFFKSYKMCQVSRYTWTKLSVSISCSETEEMLRISTVEKGVAEVNQRMFKKHRVKQASEILETANELFDGKLAIAFSGGKDSLVAIHLAMKVNPKLPVVFSSTTVEFPETLSFVRDLARNWNFDLRVVSPKKSFFRMVTDKGVWASHEDRWCCRPCKEDPTVDLLVKEDLQAEITGTTRTESLYRRSLAPIKMPKKEPYLIRVNPIYDWNQQEVWSYIHLYNLPVNPLYGKGYRRIGCWCCPLNGPSHFTRVKSTHPMLYKFLRDFTPRHPALVRKKIK